MSTSRRLLLTFVLEFLDVKINSLFCVRSKGKARSAVPQAQTVSKTGDISEELLSPAKRKKVAAVTRAKKEYVPQVATANYAFLIVMYREHLRGRE